MNNIPPYRQQESAAKATCRNQFAYLIQVGDKIGFEDDGEVLDWAKSAMASVKKNSLPDS